VKSHAKKSRYGRNYIHVTEKNHARHLLDAVALLVLQDILYTSLLATLLYVWLPVTPSPGFFA
jgi:hypothetical protein